MVQHVEEVGMKVQPACFAQSDAFAHGEIDVALKIQASFWGQIGGRVFGYSEVQLLMGNLN